MYHLLRPDSVVDTLFEIDSDFLKSQGIKGLIFDLDNTIVPWDSSDMCPNISAWLQDLIGKGFKISIVSNNWHKRVKNIANCFDLPFVSRAYKPAKTGFRRALAAMDLQPNEAAVIGDQLFTDVLGGNRMGLYTIWVKPLTSQEFIGTRIHRRFEKLAIRLLKSKGMLK